MKLSDTKPFYETSDQMQEHFFGIKDQGMIFDILRSKMYSNPILAICREIASNARDAHREVGKADEPIHIHLPFGLEPEYKIKDYGPGISPDRMTNIFIQYTASTKRDDNTQTGGFGLGAKTPFSYSDQFSVTTVHDGIKYSYICSIDDTRVGKLVLLDKRSSDEVNSTEISIPVKPIDFNNFRSYTEQVCTHWDVKPIITGGQITWPTFTKVLDGQGWAIMGSSDWQRAAKLVIDGIEYPLELDALRKYADAKLIDAARGNFVMYFGVGELSLSATREQIFLDKPTQDKIGERLKIITDEIRQKVTDKINTFANLWEANLYYRTQLNTAFNNLNFLGKLYWKTFELKQGYVDLKCPVFTFTRGKWSRKNGHDPNKLTRGRGRTLQFVEKSEIYVNDLPIKEPNPRHLKKAFDANPDLKTVQVICPDDKITEDVLNQDIHLDEMQPKRLSSITKAHARAYTPSANRLLVFKFDPGASAFRQVSYDSIDQDTNKKVLCLLNREENIREPLLANGTALSFRSLKSITLVDPQTSFYGVDKATDTKRIEEEFNDFDKLDDYIESKILNNKSINYVEIKFAQEYYHQVDDRMHKHLDKFEKLIENKQSHFLARLQLHKKLKKMMGSDIGLLEIYQDVKGVIENSELKKFAKDNPTWDIEKVNREYENKYPLLTAIHIYDYSNHVEHIAHYVNTIDKI
jgi:hypothetical protein